MGSTSHLAAKRARSSVEPTVSASEASVISRYASGPSRTTRSGATIRLFGVSSRAGRASPGSSVATSFESIRSRNSAAPGPSTAT